jgi:Ca2+-binding RTX toxin-like protein
MTIVLAASEFGHVERRLSDSALLVNGVTCDGGGTFAKSTTALRATMTGDVSGGETLLLDFTNGLFLKGSAAAVAVNVDLGGGGSDVLQFRGSPLKDTMRAGALGWDTTGDGVRDLTLVNASSVIVSLGDGDDVFSAAGGGTLGGPSTSGVALTVYGGPGKDTLTGGDGDDALFGDSGNDTLSGGSSELDADEYSGGADLDTVTWATRTTAVTVTVGAGANDGATGESDDVGADVEVVIGGTGADTFTGWTGAQTFYGGAGDDVFRMGLLASKGAGADTVYGEAGQDTVDYGARLEAVTVTMDFNAANDGNAAATESDTIRSDVERLICPTAAVACSVTGNALDNRITGGGGSDTLSGGAGDDTFIIGASSGIGAGADVITGGAGVDRVDFTAFGASLNVRMDEVASATQGKRIGLDVEDLACPTASACTVLANALNNHLWGVRRSTRSRARVEMTSSRRTAAPTWSTAVTAATFSSARVRCRWASPASCSRCVYGCQAHARSQHPSADPGALEEVEHPIEVTFRSNSVLRRSAPLRASTSFAKGRPRYGRGGVPGPLPRHAATPPVLTRHVTWLPALTLRCFADQAGTGLV